MPEGVMICPSGMRALMLPDVPWLMPLPFISRQAAMISRRSASCCIPVFLSFPVASPRAADVSRLLGGVAVAHHDLDRQAGQDFGQGRVGRPVVDQIIPRWERGRWGQK